MYNKNSKYSPIVILILLVSSVIYSFIINDNALILAESYSPDTLIKIEIQYDDTDIEGSFNIDICSKRQDSFFSTKELSADIANNGKELNEKNCSIEWINNVTVQITLHGEGQIDEIYIIDYSKSSEVSITSSFDTGNR